MRELRTLMSEIAPPNLETDGLRAALDELLARFETKDVSTEFDCDDDLPLSEPQRQLVYRIAQEGTRNIVKHSQARHVVLRIKKQKSHVHVELIDDGVGFSPQVWEERQREGHAALTHLIQTAQDGGANLEIDSTAGKGTTLVVTLPAISD